ncbi:hypothetical protein [Rhodopila sp.]|uniref:hypothetical protein n=1 Tax=Rhodopila sp. TaxID=2480087 RepID=UPI003D124E8B
MRGAEPVNNEFEVGFNQTFEVGWYRVELAGRVIMIIFVTCALLGLLGRGPYSHASKSSPSREISVDYEPIARHGTSTMVTVHLKTPSDAAHPVRLLVDQHMIEPMGYQHATPLPEHASIGDAGVWLTFNERADQHDALVRFDLSPTALGFIPMQVSDGSNTVKWTMLVVP